MAASLNKLAIIGRLGADPEMRYISDGKPVTNFRVAVDGGKDTTTWFNVSSFGKTAEFVNQYLTKGALVYVEGPHTSSTYENKEGQKITKWDLRGYTVQILSPKGAAKGDAVSDDEIPF